MDKVFAIIFPISAFVAAGFEHSVANMYFIPLGLLLKDRLAVSGVENLSWLTAGANLVPVSLGNIVGGAGMVTLVYFFIYQRGNANTKKPR
jgi:formate/nitrite transporter FocA (FNT family)